jgi:formylglycine-generating enzyme required for sulfatase activity
LAVRIFLASPGDVADERALARRVIDQLAYDPFLRGRVTVEMVAWDRPGADTPMLATMTPQEAISKQLPKPSECDVVVVIFWSRMGTPLPPEYEKPDGSRYLSGSEWEYLDARTASEKTGSPKVLVYRRTEEPTFGAEDPEIRDRLAQWQSVKNFFATFSNPDGSIRSAYNEYDTPDSFERKLNGHLRELLSQLLQERVPEIQPAQSATTDTDAESEDEAGTVAPIWVGSPFPGLRSFGPDDAPIFFGRGLETDGLVRRVADGQRFIAVVGVSGCGKSSLVMAGLLPRLADNAVPGSKDWVVKRITPGELGDDPFIALASAFRSVVETRKQSIREAARALEETPAQLNELVDALLSDHPRWAEVLLYVDQFEELFTVAAERHRSAFSRLIAAAVECPRLRVVLTVRGDFYHRCIAQPELARLLRTGSYPLAAPGPAALEEMIARPAERAGLLFDPETLPQTILADTGSEPGALPLMAFALEELYEAKTDDGKLDASAYEGFDGVQGAIGQRAEQTFEELDRTAQQALPSVFSQLVEVNEAEDGWVATRRRAPRETLTGHPGAAALVDAFIGARLLTGGRDADGHAVIEVAHEALLRNWERLRDWITERGRDIQLVRKLRQAADDWQAGQGDRWKRRLRREAEAAMGRLGSSPEEPVPAFLSASRRRTARVAGFVSLAGVFSMLAVAFFAYLHFSGLNTALALDVLGARAGLDYNEPEMVLIDGGSFDMGCLQEQGCAEDELPVRKNVAIQPFRIGKYEVTFEEYDLFAELTDRRRPDSERWGRGRRPVINVGWNDAVAYAEWLSEVTHKRYRLPTEAEWEYAARAGTTTPFSTGKCIHTDQANYSGHFGYRDCPATEVHRGKTVEVGSLGSPNPWGLHDMHGNVWEWVQDCWHWTYNDAPEDGSAWEMAGGGDCNQRVLRDASWNFGPDLLRSADRDRLAPDEGDNGIGFRLAQDVE